MFACVCVALVIQHAMHMSHIAICVLPRSTIFFPTLFHKRHDFRGGGEVTELKMCVLIFSTNLSETFLILRTTGRDMIKNVYWSCLLLHRAYRRSI